MAGSCKLHERLTSIALTMMFASWTASQWIAAARAQIAMKIHRIAMGDFLRCTPYCCANRLFWSHLKPGNRAIHIVGFKSTSHRRLASCDVANSDHHTLNPAISIQFGCSALPKGERVARSHVAFGSNILQPRRRYRIGKPENWRKIGQK